MYPRRAPSRSIFVVLPILFLQSYAIYNPLREYAGSSFFDRFAYYGNVDNTTWGNVTFLDQPTAVSQRLTYVNSAGNAVVKVDNTTTILPAAVVNRGSIRLTSLDSYGIGSLILIDAVHIPFGCSVWPSFWTYGIEAEWPNAGEIDIIEAINDMDHNQYALHTTPGCMQAQNPGLQSGTTIETDCSVAQGCTVMENKPNSFGVGFAQAGGGVFAIQLSAAGFYTWFWSRAEIPASISSATSTSTVDISTWGTPTASYPATGCNLTEFFPPQNLILLTTLCGVWAGVPSIYRSTCNTPTNSCVDNIVGNGSNYADAYWEIRYIRTYVDASISTTLSPNSVGEATALASSTKTVVVQETAAVDASPTPTLRSSSSASQAIQFSFVTLFSLAIFSFSVC